MLKAELRLMETWFLQSILRRFSFDLTDMKTLKDSKPHMGNRWASAISKTLKLQTRPLDKSEPKKKRNTQWICVKNWPSWL